MPRAGSSPAVGIFTLSTPDSYGLQRSPQMPVNQQFLAIFLSAPVY
jgi:hypothetical protein